MKKTSEYVCVNHVSIEKLKLRNLYIQVFDKLFFAETTKRHLLQT